MGLNEQKLQLLCRRAVDELNIRPEEAELLHGEYTDAFGVYFDRVRGLVEVLQPEFIGRITVTLPTLARKTENQHVCDFGCVRGSAEGAVGLLDLRQLDVRKLRNHIVDLATLVVVIAINNHLAEHQRIIARHRRPKGDQ